MAQSAVAVSREDSRRRSDAAWVDAARAWDDWGDSALALSPDDYRSDAAREAQEDVLARPVVRPTSAMVAPEPDSPPVARRPVRRAAAAEADRARFGARRDRAASVAHVAAAVPVVIPTDDPRPERTTPARETPARDAWTPDRPESGPRVVTIRGRGAERYVPQRPVDRRRPERRYERSGFRPDRAAMWAVLLGLMLVLAAVASAHGAVIR